MQDFSIDDSEILAVLDCTKAKSISVSKGCFVYKGKRKGVKTANYVTKEDVNSGKDRRLKLFHQLWGDISDRVQTLQTEMNRALFDNVVEYSKNAYKGDLHAKLSTKEIPTAALLTGVNLPDHAVMFKSLTSLLREEVTRHVAILRSKDCHTIKQMTNLLIEQVTGEDPMGANLRRHSPTISTLAKWYQERIRTSDVVVPSKKRRTSKPVSRPVETDTSAPQRIEPIVIVLEDLERFSANIVQDFIMTCSNHVEKLPVILILGIATAVTTIHRILPQSVTSLLSLEKFQAAPSSDYFSTILTETVMTSSRPFKLGARVFQQLVDIFLMHDFSVQNYTSSLQFLLMDHFYGNKASVLCCHGPDIGSTVKGLSKSSLTDIRQCASFMRFVEKANPDVQTGLLLDDKLLKEHILMWLTELHLFHDNFYPVLQCLHVLSSSVPRHPLGRQLREVYGRCLESDIFDQPDYQNTFSLLRTMSRDSLVTSLDECVSRLNVSTSPEMIEVATSLMEYIKRFHQIDTASDAQTEDAEELTEVNDETVSPAQLPKKMDIATLRKKLTDMKNRKKTLSVYEVVRRDTLDYLDGIFRIYIYCYKSLPLHECVYYESSVKVRQHINAAPLTALHMALTNPHYYIKNEKARSEHGQINELLPDVSIVFKLHLECGRLINLYDWLQAFITIATTGKKSNKNSDKVLQARFIRAVCELQFLGFIKPTKRKTDHVMRLTWGGC